MIAYLSQPTYTMQETFGTWLTQMREARGLSIRQLAAKANISHATVSKIESSSVGASREMVVKIAEALGVSRSEAIRAWLEDDTQDGGAIQFVTDPETLTVVEAYEGASRANKELLRAMAEKIREIEREHTIGSRDDEGDAADSQ